MGRGKRPATYKDIEALPTGWVGEIIDDELWAFPRPAAWHGRAAPARPSRIVVRGLAADVFWRPPHKLFIEGSEDGERWVPLGELVRPSLGQADRVGGPWAVDNPMDPELEDTERSLYLEGPLRTEVAVRHVRLWGQPSEGSRRVELKALREVSLFE